MTYILSHLPLLMFMSLVVGSLLQHNMIKLLGATALFFLIGGVALGELWGGYVTRLPALFISEYIFDARLVAFCCVLGLGLLGLKAIGWNRVTDVPTIRVMLSLMLIYGATIGLVVVLADKSKFDGILIGAIAIIISLIDLIFFKKTQAHSMGWRRIVEGVLIAVLAVVWFYIFRRLNAEHYVVGLVRGVDFAPGWFIFVVFALGFILALWVNLLGVVLIFVPFFKPISDLFENSGTYFYVLVLGILIICLTAQSVTKKKQRSAD